MKIFKFELNLNLDLHFVVKFYGKCDGVGTEA